MKRLPALLVFTLVPPLGAQNLTTEGGSGPILKPIRVSYEEALRVLREESVLPESAPPRGQGGEDSPSPAAAARRKLRAEINRFLAAEPLAPWVHVLGISGIEVYFAHPSTSFYVLSLALPHLEGKTRAAVAEYLRRHFAAHPPHGRAGYGLEEGRRRESYRLPPEVVRRAPAASRPRSAFGVYALWLYARRAHRPELLEREYSAVKELISALLKKPYDVRDSTGDDTAQRLNGDIAGLVGYGRMARANGDAEEEKKVAQQLAGLLERRVNLERTDPRLVRPTRSVTGNWNHAGKVPRYLDLVPELARFLRSHGDGITRYRVSFFEEELPTWHLAYGERLIGGENYTSPAHLARAGFSAYALLTDASPRFLTSRLDVPWVRGDLYYIEKCALLLWVAGGRESVGLGALGGAPLRPDR